MRTGQWSVEHRLQHCLNFLPDRQGLGFNRHSTVTHYQRPNMTHPQEGGTGGEVSEILFFSAKSKRRPSLIYSMQIIPVCLSIVARRKGVSATRRGGSNWTPISLLVGHPCKLFHRLYGDSTVWDATSTILSEPSACCPSVASASKFSLGKVR